MKKNIKMIISYDGTRYNGWEHQQNTDMTIQGKLEAVLERMIGGGDSDAFKKSGSGVTVIGAGRTDAGVHARAMTANVILDTELTCDEIRVYMNRYLPDDISVNKVTEASDNFHSRFNAKGKTYRYTFWVGDVKPVFDRKYVSVLDKAPDVGKMREAAEKLIGTHDFKSFCGNPRMKKSTVREVDSIKIEESGNYIRLYFHGNGFLQNMVRIMTGTLLEVGYGKKKPEDIEAIIEGKDRQLAGFTAEAKGLTLMKVDYE
ncbi:MAG: tRNA pseudouridine(38-40) synthase TruA [Eubacterium sp.]|nr:tRNA pseudouridine(38-40) synthase TruA [Eubacterium sp.]